MNVNDAMSELELYSSVHLDIDCPPVGEWPTILESGRAAFSRGAQAILTERKISWDRELS